MMGFRLESVSEVTTVTSDIGSWIGITLGLIFKLDWHSLWRLANV